MLIKDKILHVWQVQAVFYPVKIILLYITYYLWFWNRI